MVDTAGYTDPQQSIVWLGLAAGILALPDLSLAITITLYNPGVALKLVKYAEYIPSPAVISGYPVPVSVSVTCIVSPPGVLTIATTSAPDTGIDPCMISVYSRTGADTALELTPFTSAQLCILTVLSPVCLAYTDMVKLVFGWEGVILILYVQIPGGELDLFS